MNRRAFFDRLAQLAGGALAASQMGAFAFDLTAPAPQPFTFMNVPFIVIRDFPCNQVMFVSKCLDPEHWTTLQLGDGQRLPFHRGEGRRLDSI